MREHVVAASKAMKMGDWKTCHRFIVNEKMNGKVWDLFPEADKVRGMLVRSVEPGLGGGGSMRISCFLNLVLQIMEKLGEFIYRCVLHQYGSGEAGGAFLRYFLQHL